MKLKLNNQIILIFTLFYPILLGIIFLFNISPHFVTVPYFAFVFFLISLDLLNKRKLRVHKEHLTNIFLTILVLIISILNFTSIRYSLPIYFSAYLFMLQLFVILNNDGLKENKKIERFFFYSYLIISLFFLWFINHSNVLIGDRFSGFTGSPTTYSAILILVYIFIDTQIKIGKLRRILLYLTILYLVYLTKTRLMFLLLIVYPVILRLISTNWLNLKQIYWLVLGALFFMYPLYGVLVDLFPNLILARYEGGRDSSFSFRWYLYNVVEKDFLSGDFANILFGKGNEWSRNLVEMKIGHDAFPHNDFIRIFNDWGIVGGVIFFYYLYRIARKNLTILMLVLVYLITFYSNMIFNLFMISVLVFTSELKRNKL